MSEYNNKQYRTNKEIVKRRSKGLCSRCMHLHNRVTPAQECDHLIPLSRGGKHTLDNLWYLCGGREDSKTCHGEKSNREQNPRHDINFPFEERIDPNTGWPLEGDTLEDWQEYIKLRNEQINTIKRQIK